MGSSLSAESFARLAAAMHSAPTPVRTAEEVIGYARDELGADMAGITLSRNKRVQTVAPTDAVVEKADALQFELNEGTCLDAAWGDQTLAVPDLANDARWPRWAPRVAALGVASVLAAELTSASGKRIGAINLYWRNRRTFDRNDAATASIFARHAALALTASLEIADLNVALDSRKLIGQAQGILMERFALDEDRAFEVLRRYSSDNNVKLRRVAEILVATRRLPS